MIIVGVGEADFTDMENLDADRNPLVDSSGNCQARDIVQFVPFNDFAHDPEQLAKEVLKEIPKQMTEYFQSKRIRPNPADPAARAAQLQQASLGLTDQYFMMKREEMKNKLVQQKGYDPSIVDQFMTNVGCIDDSFASICGQMNTRGYVNTLRS